MDFRPYLVAVTYVVGLVVLIAIEVHPAALITFLLVGGFFALLFGALHRIEQTTKQEIKKARTGEIEKIVHHD